MSTDTIYEDLLFKNIDINFDGNKYAITLDANKKDVLIPFVKKLDSNKINFEKVEDKLSFVLNNKEANIEKEKEENIKKEEEFVNPYSTTQYVDLLFSKMMVICNDKHFINISKGQYAVFFDYDTTKQKAFIQFYVNIDCFRMEIIYGKRLIEFKLNTHDEMVKFIEKYADVIYVVTKLACEYSIDINNFDEFIIPQVGLKILYKNKYFEYQYLDSLHTFGVYNANTIIDYVKRHHKI